MIACVGFGGVRHFGSPPMSESDKWVPAAQAGYPEDTGLVRKQPRVTGPPLCWAAQPEPLKPPRSPTPTLTPSGTSSSLHWRKEGGASGMSSSAANSDGTPPAGTAGVHWWGMSPLPASSSESDDSVGTTRSALVKSSVTTPDSLGPNRRAMTPRTLSVTKRGRLQFRRAGAKRAPIHMRVGPAGAGRRRHPPNRLGGRTIHPNRMRRVKWLCAPLDLVMRCFSSCCMHMGVSVGLVLLMCTCVAIIFGVFGVLAA